MRCSFLIVAKDGTWWIGLWGGGVYSYDQKRATHLDVPDSFGLDQVLSLGEAPAGVVWIGCVNGLYRHEGQVTTNVFDPEQAPRLRKQLAQNRKALIPGLAHRRVNSLAADADQQLWIA